MFRQCGIFCFSIGSLEMFRQCGIFLFSYWSLEMFRHYGIFLFFYWSLEMFRQCGIFCFSIGVWKCSDIVVFFVFLLEFGNVPTVWHFLFFYWSLEMFRQCGIFLFFIIFYVIQTIFKLQNVSKPFSKEMFQSLCPFCPRRNENYSVNKLLFISLRQMTWLK